MSAAAVALGYSRRTLGQRLREQPALRPAEVPPSRPYPRVDGQRLTEVLRATAGDVSEAARRLGVSYTAIARRISRHPEIMPDPSTYGGEWTKRGRGRPRAPPKPPKPPKPRAPVPCKVTDDVLRAALVAAEGRVRVAAAAVGLAPSRVYQRIARDPSLRPPRDDTHAR